MSNSDNTKKHLESVANETLETFEAIETEASSKLPKRLTSSEDVLINVNPVTSPEPIKNLSKIQNANRTSLLSLQHEPAIARIVAVREDGKRCVYFICREIPVTLPGGNVELASYRSPVGRLASLPIGDEVELPNGEFLEVEERAMLRPIRDGGKWDSKNSVLEGETYGPLTVTSLRTLLERIAPDELDEQAGIDEQLLEKLLEEERESVNIIEGIRRVVLTQMELRDQPILDKFQDKIFRLPLDSRILLLGPPGSGKTTTLIRRLGQKLDLEFLSEEEQLLVKNHKGPNVTSHEESWMMFTPTSLLQQYVKESFSRERVPASDYHVRTWNDYRLEVARNKFGLLTTSTKQSGFIRQDSVKYFGDEALGNLTAWFDDFEAWQQSAYVKRLQNAAKELVSIGEGRIAELGKALVALIQPKNSVDISQLLRSLFGKATEARKLADELKSEIDGAIRQVLVLQVNRNRNFLDELAEFLDSLGATEEETVEEGEIRDEDDEEEETPRTRRKRAEVTFRRALRTQARAAVRGRMPKSGTATARIIEWIGDRGLDGEKQIEVGKGVVLLTFVRTFVNPVRLYFHGIATRYRSFRRARQSDERWYVAGAIRQTDIHPLELDMMLLSILRGARSLLSSRDVQRDLNSNSSFWAVLQPVQESFRNQIFVDEATDFSPVQLACMSALSLPTMPSFFACGDFNQRLSSWGTRSVTEVEWADSRIGIERVTVGYRQSRELNEFAREIVRIGGGADYDMVLPEHAIRDGFPPVLAENMCNDPDVGIWLADRVTEIERFVGQLPSIAILVPEEEQVRSVAKALQETLAEQNINVVACPDGQVIGQDNDIRVFDVQHIKGLEFEAVFFKDVDHLAEVYPDLFDKFLYVGATRAATFLGLTCSGSLPTAISDLRSMFSTNWDG